MKQQDIRKPKLRFPEFQGEWIEKRYKEIVSENRLGGNYENFDELSNFPLIKMGNIGRGNIILNKIQYLKIEEKICNEDILKKGDLLFNTRNTLDLVGKVAIWNNELDFALYNSNLMRMTFDNNIIESTNLFMNSLFNQLKTIKQLRSIATGTTSVAAIYNKDLNNIKFVLPSLPEQQRIADYLSTIDNKINLLEEKKEQLTQYRKSMMQKLFSQEIRFRNEKGNAFPEWEEKRLGEVSNIKTGISNRQDSDLNSAYTFFDRSQEIRKSSRFLFDCEAIIVAGEGSEFIPKYYVGKFDLHQRTYAIMDYKNTFGLYLFHYINFNRRYFERQAVGSTVKSLRLPMFEKMPIKLPTLTEQQKIADFLSAIDESIEKVNEQISQTQSFKKAMLQQMFV